MTAGALLPPGQIQFFDNSGVPLAGGLLYTYVPFTTTPQTTWVDQDETTPNTNPIILDSAGRCTLWGTGTYRLILMTSVTPGPSVLVWDAISSDGGLAGLQTQIDTINGTLATLESEISSLQSDVGTIQTQGFRGIPVFNSGSIVIPASDLKFTLIGSGGGGSGTNSGGSISNGGGAGAAAYIWMTGLTVGNTLTVTMGVGGMGGGTGTGSGGAGSATILSSGTQTISTVTANGGQGGVYGGNPGVGGMATGGDINVQGNGGSPGVGGVLYPYSPFGAGGSTELNGAVVNGVTIANQDGVQGLLVYEGVW